MTETFTIPPNNLIAWDNNVSKTSIADRPLSDRRPFGTSLTLTEELTKRKSATISAALASNPHVALPAVVHALALSSFYPLAHGHSCLQIELRETRLSVSHADQQADTEPDDRSDTYHFWETWLPEDPADLWDWCVDQSEENLLSLLAHLAGEAVNAVCRKSDSDISPRLLHADALANALNVDMVEHFTPTVENYFSRVSRTQIVADLCEANDISPEPSWSKMEKSELAVFAARELAGSCWLPEALRPLLPQADEAA